MSATPQNPSKAALGFAIIATIGAIAFASLWLRETSRKPKEVTKEIVKRVEVPVEKIREVPKEVVREVVKQVEVPAKLTEDQLIAMELGRRWLSAPLISNDELLEKVASVGVSVLLNDDVKKVVSEDRLKNKFELVLRKHGIPLDEKSRNQLLVTFEGLWDKDGLRLTYARTMSLTEAVTITRREIELRRAIATVWREGAYGFAGRTVAEQALIESADEMGEAFANRYLAARDAEKKKSAAPPVNEGQSEK